MSRDFTAGDCNMWLVQVATARRLVMDTDTTLTPAHEFLVTQVAVSWVTLGLSLITFVLLLLFACCKGGLGHMHGIMFFWILAQVPNVVLTTDILSYIDNETLQQFTEQAQALTIAGFAATQFMLMGLLTTISLSVTHFKRHHLLHVDHADIRVKLENGVLRERRSSCIFFVANFLFQVPLFVVQNVHAIAAITDFLTTLEAQEPQPYNSVISGFAIAIGVLIILFIVTYLVMMIARFPSICSLINHSVHNCLGRMLLCIIIPILVILYINDVFSVMLYYWGAPALLMTQMTGQTTGPVNIDGGCQSFIKGLDGITAENPDGPQLTHFGVFLSIIFNISEYTPLIWTVVLSLGFLSMICMQRKARKDVHDENAQQRANLVKRNNDINVTDQTQNSLWNSGQTSMEYSRNNMI